MVFPEHVVNKIRVYFVRKGCGDHTEDLVQISLLKAWKNLAQCNSDKPDFWLLAIARNTFSDWIKLDHSKRKKEYSLDATSPEGDELKWEERLADDRLPGADQQMVTDERTQRLHQEVETLPKQMRACLILWLGGKSYEEIAVVLRLSKGAVGSHINQAKNKLKDLFAEEAASRLTGGRNEI